MGFCLCSRSAPTAAGPFAHVPKPTGADDLTALGGLNVLWQMQLTSNQIRFPLFLVQQASVEGTCGGWRASHGSGWMHQSRCSDLPG